MFSKDLRNCSGFKKLLFSFFLILGATGLFVFVFASSTPIFNQIINPGILSVDIVDGSYVSVNSPSITMNPVTVNFACQAVTGTFGTTTQQIYVKNLDAADAGWTASLAAAVPTALWHSASGDFDFNDPTGSGCLDGADTDGVGGQMTIDPSAGILDKGQCASCTTTSISKGSSGTFNEGVTNSITILDAAAASNDIGDWKLTGINISQQIPKEQGAASYSIDLTLSIIAK